MHFPNSSARDMLFTKVVPLVSKSYAVRLKLYFV